MDIANALDMSPGNLYYHFKGKEPIIEALFDRFEEEMLVILGGHKPAVFTIEDNWVFTYIVLEEIYDFRFFYRNLGELIARYPSLALRFRRVLALKRQSIETTISAFEKQGLIHIDTPLRKPLVEQMLSTLTFWLSLDMVEGADRPGTQLIHDTVLQFMLLVVPYMGEAGFDAMSDMLDRHKSFSGK